MQQKQHPLPTYHTILEGVRKPQYLETKKIPVSYTKDDTLDILWKKHDEAFTTSQHQHISSEQSLLDLKLEIAERIYCNCHLCEHKCKIDRSKQLGRCGVQEAQIASQFLHFGEENILVPSYTIFFSGCTFNCVYCQNWDISQNTAGMTIEPIILAETIANKKAEGARNVNWVGGDPTSNLPYILRVLKACNTPIPQIWNSNMYCSEETMKLLHGIIDVYLTDFKYGNDACASKLSNVNNYTQIVQRNHQIANTQGEILLRHLVMPGHFNCCSRPILLWIKDTIPNASVNVMAQYHPEYQACEYAEIAQPLSHDEYLEVALFAEQLGLNLI